MGEVFADICSILIYVEGKPSAHICSVKHVMTMQTIILQIVIMQMEFMKMIIKKMIIMKKAVH